MEFEKNFKKNKKRLQLFCLLCDLFSDENNFISLIKKSTEIDLIKTTIEEKACDDETFCPKAIELYSQIKTILEEFAKENNLDYENIKD